MNYQTIIFDLDGTLLHSAPDLVVAANKVMASFGAPDIVAADFTRLIGNGMYGLIRDQLAVHGTVLSDEQYTAMVEQFGDLYGQDPISNTSLYPGVMETLAKLQETGVNLCICTNKAIERTLPIVEHFDLQMPMDHIIGRGSTLEHKPSPMPLLYLMEQTGSTPATTLMVGDTITDCDAAKNAGCDMALVTYGYRRHTVEELDFSFACDSFPDLLAPLGLA